MTHKRIAVNPIAAGSDVDQAATADVYECDRCGNRGRWDEMSHVQSGQVFKGGAMLGFLAGDYCEKCWMEATIWEAVRS